MKPKLIWKCLECGRLMPSENEAKQHVIEHPNHDTAERVWTGEEPEIDPRWQPGAAE